MRCVAIIIMIVFLTISIISSFAEETYGDGNYTISEGDAIVVDNGWEFRVLGIFMTPDGERINFRIYDPEGNAYPQEPAVDILSRIDGEQKFGTNTRLKIKAELLAVSGQSYPTDSPIASKYENAEITISSIDEALPGAFEESTSEVEEVDKNLTYDDGKLVSLNVGENISLSNGYVIELSHFSMPFNKPVLNIYDGNNTLVDRLDTLAQFNKETARDVGVFAGSYFHVMEIGNNSVDLWVVDASKIIFGTGWNLFSIPVDDGDGYGTVVESTCNNGTVWSWSNELDDYQKIGVLEDGLRIPSGKGLWVKIRTRNNFHSDHDCEILVSGKKSVSLDSMQLKAGWNLIGSPISSYGKREITANGTDFIFLYFDDIKGNCQIEKGPWQYLATNIAQVGQANVRGDRNKFSIPYNKWVRLNKGYFIKVVNDCTLSDW